MSVEQLSAEDRMKNRLAIEEGYFGYIYAPGYVQRYIDMRVAERFTSTAE